MTMKKMFGSGGEQVMADYSDYKECTDCVHYELCLHQEKFLIEHNRKDLIRRYGFGLSEPEICCNFRDRSRFVELPDYKYSAEERFRGAVQELIDIAKASETPLKILQATSESLAHFACELSKLEETKQTLKERES